MSKIRGIVTFLLALFGDYVDDLLERPPSTLLKCGHGRTLAQDCAGCERFAR